MQIIENTRNELLKRDEINALVESEQNPNFEEMRKKLSEQIKKPEENINVYSIKGSFGSKEFKIKAYVYDSKDDLEKNKIKTKKQRDAEAKEIKEVKSKSAEEVEEEKPAKGEIPEEDKPEQIKQESETKPVEAPTEEKPEEEEKAIKEEEQAKEENKEV